MKKNLATAIAMLFVAAALAAGPGVALDNEPADLPESSASELTRAELHEMGFDHWIVGFHELPEERSTYGGHDVVRVMERLDAMIVEAPEPATLHAHALQDERVRYVEYDDPVYAQLLYTPNDPLHTNDALWGHHRIGAEAAWDVTLGSTSVKIAVVDTGMNFEHEEFAGQNRVLNGWNYVDNNDDTQDTSNCDFHGTHVSGTLGATIDNDAGIAGLSQSTILPHKIFDAGGIFGCGAATTSNIADALMDAGDEGAHISQNSWGGGGSSSTLDAAIKHAHDLGTTHVAAAGNDGPCSDCVSTPWVDNPDKVNIISSIDDDDGFSSFSSEGPEVTVTAPGRGVGSSTSGTSDYHAYSGTSMAAPHVSGSLALYIAANGDVGFNTLRSELTGNAEDIGLSTDRQGAGLLRVDDMLGDGGGSPTGPTASFTFDCTELTCDFDASDSTAGDAPIDTYEWDFGDGNTDTGVTTTHTYAEDDTYTVTLTVTDEDGLDDTDTQDVTVEETPEPASEMHVHDISFSESNGNPSRRDVFFHVDIRDENEDALSGVEVCLDMERLSDGATNSDCGTTGTDGSVTLVWESAGRDDYTACVTSLTKTDFTWDQEADHASDGSCHTGSSK